MTALASRDSHEIMERVLAVGDLSQLTPAERNAYYSATCSSLGLNALTRPFDYLRLSGKLVLYAKRDCADQLRKLHGISLRILEQKVEGGLFIVTVEARDKEGRVDTDMGAVAIQNLQGEARANALMKGLTKAKRRATLSICGLGMLDETEIADIPAGDKQAWEEPKPEAEEPVRAIIKIVGADGAPVYTGSIWQEGLKAYGAAKKAWGVDPAAVARANLESLRLILPHARNGTAERLAAEIEAAEATLPREGDEDVAHDRDGVVIEGESPEPITAPEAA